MLGASRGWLCKPVSYWHRASKASLCGECEWLEKGLIGPRLAQLPYKAELVVLSCYSIMVYGSD